MEADDEESKDEELVGIPDDSIELIPDDAMELGFKLLRTLVCIPEERASLAEAAWEAIPVASASPLLAAAVSEEKARVADPVKATAALSALEAPPLAPPSMLDAPA